MAVTIVGPGSSTGNTALVSSRSVAVPNNAGANPLAAGDVVVVRLSRWESINPAVTAPSGFVARTQQVNGSGKLNTYLKRLTGADTGTYAFSWTGSMWTTAQARAYRAVDPAADLSTIPMHQLTGSGTAWPAATLSGVSAGALDWHGYSENGGAHVVPTSFTQLSANDCDIGAYRIVAAGSYTTAGGSSVSSSLIVSMLHLPEATAGTTPVTATRVASWDVLTSLSATRATTWRVVAITAATRAATWDVLAAVAATRATTWRVRAAVAATRATTWRAAAAVAGSRGTTWRTAARATGTRLTTWRAQAQVTASRATTWRVRSAVTSTRSSAWNVASTSTTVVATRGTTWGVAGRVAATRPTTWDTLAALAATRSTTWDTTARATATRPTTWRARAQVNATRNASWAVCAVTTGTRATTWDVTTLVTLTRAATWDALASLTATRAATWRTLGPATATRATTWAIESDLEPQAETVLTATHVASSALTAAHLQPELSPSNAPSSLLEVSHGV